MKPTQHHNPRDRLTRITDAGLEGARGHSEFKDDDRVIVLIYGDDGMAGIGLGGYNGDTVQAATDMLSHIEAVFEANGIHMSFVPLEQKGRG